MWLAESCSRQPRITGMESTRRVANGKLRFPIVQAHRHFGEDIARPAMSTHFLDTIRMGRHRPVNSPSRSSKRYLDLSRAPVGLSPLRTLPLTKHCPQAGRRAAGEALGYINFPFNGYLLLDSGNRNRLRGWRSATASCSKQARLTPVPWTGFFNPKLKGQTRSNHNM